MEAGAGARNERQPHPVDTHVGNRVRQRRVFLGYSQEKLARSLGLTFQQVQKYERGANRISSSKLFELARLLDVPVGFFFEGVDDELEKEVPTRAPAHRGIGQGETAGDVANSETNRETLRLVDAYYKIEDRSVRTEVLSLMKVLGKSSIKT